MGKVVVGAVSNGSAVVVQLGHTTFTPTTSHTLLITYITTVGACCRSYLPVNRCYSHDVTALLRHNGGRAEVAATVVVVL